MGGWTKASTRAVFGKQGAQDDHYVIHACWYRTTPSDRHMESIHQHVGRAVFTSIIARMSAFCLVVVFIILVVNVATVTFTRIN